MEAALCWPGAHPGQPSANDRDHQPLDTIAVAAWSPRLDVLVAIGVKVKAPWGRENLPAPEKNFEGFRARNAGAELASHWR